VAAADADVPTAASMTAKDPYSFDNGAGGTSVSVAAGGTVSFGYPSGASYHSVVFDPAQPTSCTDMPAAPSGPGWAGSCRFDTPGTYTFHCGLHSFMTGKVEVVDPNAPTTGTTGPGPTNTGPGSGGGGPTFGYETPPSAKVARRQTGVVVRGKVTTPAGPARIAVTAFAAKRAVATRARRVRVGSVTTHSSGTGPTAFSLKLNRAARRALHRHGRLSVSLRMVIEPDAGTATRMSVTVVLHEKH
jgi:plastocyanin